MTPKDRELLVAWGIFIGVALCRADGDCTLSLVVDAMVAKGLLNPLVGKITTTWLLDVYRLGPFEKVGFDGGIRIRKEHKHIVVAEPAQRPSCRY
jgi:hypothetical protein